MERMLMLSMETDRSIVHVKSEDVYEDLVEMLK